MAFLYSIKNENGMDSSNSTSNSNDSLSTLINQSPYSDNRSSVGSIPWAQDAIKQNQMEFEKIERIFYCEEDLPNDRKTREEFLEWMEAFPHLRVIGKKIPIYFEPRPPVASYEFHEEILAIHPARNQQKQKHRHKSYHTSDNFNSSRKEQRRTEHINSHQKVMKCSTSNTNLGNLNNEITKYLKISPSPVLKRRYANKSEMEPINLNSRRENPQGLQFDPKNPYYLKIPSAEGTRLINVKSSVFLTNSNSNSNSNLLTTTKIPQVMMKSSQSASNMRMPPILTLKLEEAPTNIHVIKSAIVGKVHEMTCLPALQEPNFNDRNNNNSNSNNNNNNNMRSISAVTLKKSSLAQNYPNNTSNTIKVVKFT